MRDFVNSTELNCGSLAHHPSLSVKSLTSGDVQMANWAVPEARHGCATESDGDRSDKHWVSTLFRTCDKTPSFLTNIDI